MLLSDLFTLTNVQLARNICQRTIDYFELGPLLNKNVNVVDPLDADLSSKKKNKCLEIFENDFKKYN